MFARMIGNSVAGVWSAFGARERTLMIGGSVACLWVCRQAAVLAGVPAEPGFSGSLLAGPGGVGKVLVAAVIIGIGPLVGAVVAGSMGAEGAVFCAGVGLSALAVRCGPIRPVLEYAGGRAVLGRLAVESVALGAAMVGGWAVLDRLVRLARAKGAGVSVPSVVPGELDDPTAQDMLAATGVTLLVMAALQFLLVQTDTASQCLASVAVAAFLGTLAGYSYRPLASGVWYWIAPCLLGAIGYIAAGISGDGTATGELHGWFAPLARPTPLHYASLGTALAVLAHWCSRRWALADGPVELEPDAPAVTT